MASIQGERRAPQNILSSTCIIFGFMQLHIAKFAPPRHPDAQTILFLKISSYSRRDSGITIHPIFRRNDPSVRRGREGGRERERSHHETTRTSTSDDQFTLFAPYSLPSSTQHPFPTHPVLVSWRLVSWLFSSFVSMSPSDQCMISELSLSPNKPRR